MAFCEKMVTIFNFFLVSICLVQSVKFQANLTFYAVFVSILLMSISLVLIVAGEFVSISFFFFFFLL